MTRWMAAMAMTPGVAAALLSAVLAAILPILLTDQPAQEDYPGHLARAYVLHDLLTQGGRFDTFYVLRPAILPNLAIDIVVVGLQCLGMGVETAGRVFLILAALAAPVGVVAIHRQLFGRVSVLPFAAFGFAHNQVMMWGFTNYLFGVGLAFLGFAYWLRLDAARPGVGLARRSGVLLAWALAAYLSHLMAALMLLGLVAAHHGARAAGTAWRGGGWRLAEWRLGDVGPPWLVAGAALLALHLLASFAADTGADAAGWAAGSVAGLLRERLGMMAHVTEAYAPLPEHAATLALALALAAAGLAGALRVNWAMLAPIAGLGALFLAAPNTLSGTGYIPDRIPIVLLFLALASVDVARPGARAWPGGVLACAVVLLVAVRAGTATASWLAADRAYRPILAALGRLPPGATIFSGAYYHGNVLNELRAPWAVMSAMATIRSGAFSVNVFARPGQNVVEVRPEYQALAALLPNVVGVYPPVPPPFHGDLFAPERLARFEYVLAHNARLHPGGPPAVAREMARSGDTVLYRIVRHGD